MRGIRPVTTALLVSAICIQVLPAQNPFRSFFPGQKEIWTSPKKLERKHWPWIVLAGATTAAFIATDRNITDGLPNTPAQFRWGTRVSRLGGAAGLAIFSGTLLTVGAIGHDRQWKTVGAASSEALMHSLVVTYALKGVFARERPDAVSGAGDFWAAGRGSMFKSDNSFPSGHAMASWAVAAAVSSQFPDRRYVPWLAYGFASAISFSRVAAHRHYASDVAVGAGTGYLIGRMVGNRYRKETLKKHGWLTRPDVDVDLRPGARTAALRVRWTPAP